MKIQQLFDELKTITENKDEIFTDSGMVNCYNKMKYGFFPLALGVLNKTITIESDPKEIQIDKDGIMVLGNDFGTVTYVNDVTKYSDGFGEIKSSTIINMLNFIPELKADNVFFTNFYQGIRLDDGRYTGTTMTKRMYDYKPNKVKDEYQKLCNEFFKTQLELAKPQKVICLGHDVKNALITSGFPFQKWEPKSDSLKKLYSKDGDMHVVNMKLNGIKFVVIPHPCYPVNLKKSPYLEKLKVFLEST
jgi:hypothetical protein